MVLENTFSHTDENGLRYRLFFENTRDIILFVRLNDGRILDANPAAVQAYGWSRAELLNLSIFDFRAANPPAQAPHETISARRGAGRLPGMGPEAGQSPLLRLAAVPMRPLPTGRVRGRF